MSETARGAQRTLSATLVEFDEALQCEVCLPALDGLWKEVDRLEHFNPTIITEVRHVGPLQERLACLPLREKLTAVVAGSDFHQWAFCQHLLAEARDLWHKDPEAAFESALVAAEIADRLDPESYQPEWTADLRAKAQAYLANSFRVMDQFAKAEECFLEAERELANGTGGGRVEATVLSLKASLLIFQYRYLEAEAVIKQVEASHFLRDELHESGRTMLLRAKLLHCQGRYEDAAAEAERAAAHLDAEVDPLLPILARKNAAAFLLEASKVEEARSMLDGLPEIEEPMVGIRRSWIEGRLLSAEGRYGEAIDVLSDARDEFARRELAYQAGMISLDLGLVAFKAGAFAEVRGYAEEAMVLVGRAAAKHEAIAAIRLVLIAAERKTLSLAVLQAARKKLAAQAPG